MKLVKKNGGIGTLIRPFCIFKKMESASKDLQKEYYGKLMEFGINNGKDHSEKTLRAKLPEGTIDVSFKTTAKANNTLAKALLKPEIYESIRCDDIDIDKLRDMVKAGLIEQIIADKIISTGIVKSMKVKPNETLEDEIKFLVEDTLKEFKV